MSRCPIAGICVAVAVALLAGCGGSNKPVAKTEPAGATGAKTLCRAVLEAQKQYTAATNAMGLQFENKPLESRARRALETMLLRVRQLRRVAPASQQRALAPLGVALSNQLKTFIALEQRDLKTAARYGNSINVPLRRGMADLRKICAPSA
jgi:hypothetical protein